MSVVTCIKLWLQLSIAYIEDPVAILVMIIKFTFSGFEIQGGGYRNEFVPNYIAFCIGLLCRLLLWFGYTIIMMKILKTYLRTLNQKDSPPKPSSIFLAIVVGLGGAMWLYVFLKSVITQQKIGRHF